MQTRQTDPGAVVPGPVRLPELESRARFIAATALTAACGHTPPPRFAAYATAVVVRRLTARAKACRSRSPRPRYHGRTYLCRVNRRVIEATVVASDGTAVRAVAIRLEYCQGAWLASDLDIV
ncbi:MAG: Rv3235 family protein [Bifidobacteriaceae bacterium]|nr:Rv3235 family protein [Bifidobacteriaceae bacterium]